jgi:hypothetical protein
VNSEIISFMLINFRLMRGDYNAPSTFKLRNNLLKERVSSIDNYTNSLLAKEQVISLAFDGWTA